MIRALVKNAALGALRSARVFSVAANSSYRRNALLILCYHGISTRDEHQWMGHLYMTPELFRRRLETLKSFDARVLPLQEGIERLVARSLPPRSVAITFDDGFCDFLRHGVPLLGEFGYPCTLYLTTHYCQYRVPIFNLVANYLLWKSGASKIQFPALGLDNPMPCETEKERFSVVRQLLEWAAGQGLDTMAKDRAVRRLAGHLGIDYSDVLERRLFQILTPEEVGLAARAGVDVQLHTHRHRAPRDRGLFLREIGDNRERIREFTGREPRHFCYPSGDYAPEFLPWLREAGIRSATTCDGGLALPDSEPLLLPRLLDGSRVPQVVFESWLCGLFV